MTFLVTPYNTKTRTKGTPLRVVLAKELKKNGESNYAAVARIAREKSGLGKFKSWNFNKFIKKTQTTRKI